MSKRRKPSEVIKVAEKAQQRLDVAELAHELMSAFGGAREFATSYFREFDEAPCGSIAKAKLMEGVLRIVVMANAKKGSDDETNLTDEELDRAITDAAANCGIEPPTLEPPPLEPNHDDAAPAPPPA